MSPELQVIERPRPGNEIIERALVLLNQQIWCWGRDILRPEGNWLNEIGFKSIKPPSERHKCSSMYCLELPGGKSVVLRGFGSFYGCSERGSVFLHRYKFLPKYTKLATLENLPWAIEDLPEWDMPNASQQNFCASLTLDFINWVKSYEEEIIDRLGVEYRASILSSWEHAKAPIIPAKDMANAWGMLGDAISKDLECLV